MNNIINIKEIMDAVEAMSHENKMALVEQIMSMMKNDEAFSEETCGQMVSTGYSDRPNCPHCQASGKMGFVTKRGFKAGAQRYYCKSCGKTFVPTTKTAFERTRKPSHVWKKFIEMTITGKSLKECAYECNICYQTAFTWRHKILNVFQQNQKDTKMDGRVEMDEMFVPLSYKGNRVKGAIGTRRVKERNAENGLPRKSYKRGSDNKPKSPKERACVFCMVEDGNHAFYTAVPGVGAMTEKMLDATFAKHVIKESALVLVDQYRVTKDYLNNNGYTHESLLSNTSDNYHDHKPEIRDGLHLQHVNSFHSHIRRFLKKYFGVSTKYLENYLALFVWMKTMKSMKQERKINEVSITRASTADCYISRKELEAYPAVPQCA